MQGLVATYGTQSAAGRGSRSWRASANAQLWLHTGLHTHGDAACRPRLLLRR